MTNGPFAFGATVATAKTETEKHPVIGFNAQTGLYEDFIEAGIIDSTKMVCSALQVAASVAGLIITTEVAIALLPDAEAPPSRHYGYDDF